MDDERRHVLEAVAMAIDRRADLFAIVDESATPDDASTRLRARWGLSATQADAVLNLQVARFTAQGRERIAAELDRG